MYSWSNISNRRAKKKNVNGDRQTGLFQENRFLIESDQNYCLRSKVVSKFWVKFKYYNIRNFLKDTTKNDKVVKCQSSIK